MTTHAKDDPLDKVPVGTEYSQVNVPHMFANGTRIGTVHGMRRYGENVYVIGVISLEAINGIASGFMASNRNLEICFRISFTGPYKECREIREWVELTSQPNTYELCTPFYIMHSGSVSDDFDIHTRAPVILDEYITNLGVCTDFTDMRISRT